MAYNFWEKRKRNRKSANGLNLSLPLPSAHSSSPAHLLLPFPFTLRDGPRIETVRSLSPPLLHDGPAQHAEPVASSSLPPFAADVWGWFVIAVVYLQMTQIPRHPFPPPRHSAMAALPPRMVKQIRMRVTTDTTCAPLLPLSLTLSLSLTHPRHMAASHHG